MVARPTEFSVFLHNSPLNNSEITARANQAIPLCMMVTDPRALSDVMPTLGKVKTYIEHARYGAPSVLVTEIVVQRSFCPSISQLQCLSTYTGAITATKEIMCLASIDVLFTSLDPAQVRSTFQEYVDQIRVFDTDIRLEQTQECEEVVYIRHRASATEYHEIVTSEKSLSNLHNNYLEKFQDLVIFDSGVHALGIYNVTMKIGPLQQQFTPDYGLQSQKQRRQEIHMQRVLQLLGVFVPIQSINAPSAMSLRQDAVQQTDDAVDNCIIFSLVGAIISTSDVIQLTNTTIWLTTSQFAETDSVRVLGLTSSITGRLFFNALSVSDARRLYAHVAVYKVYYDAKGLIFNAITTQRFIIPGNRMQEGVAVQENIQSQPGITTSSYTLRVMIIIPVEANMLNTLLVEVLKTVIFKKMNIDAVRLVSISKYIGYDHSPSTTNGSTTANSVYSSVVYELPVNTVQNCAIDYNVNSEDYYLELSTVVSSLFGLDVSVELNGMCIVTNTLHYPEKNQTGPLCKSIQNRKSTTLHASNHAFFNQSNVAYTETCKLQTEIGVAASFNHVDNSTFTIEDMQHLRQTLSYGNARLLTISMEATIQLVNNTVDLKELVYVFGKLYTPAFQGNMQNETTQSNTGILSIYNDGMSAAEKTQCVPLLQSATRPISCVNNLSVSSTHRHYESCLQIVGLNNRIDLKALKQFILSKTTTNMIQSSGIRISNQLHAFVERIACKGGVNSLVQALLLPHVDDTQFQVKSVGITKISLVVQHSTPFIHIPDYDDNVLRLLKDDRIKPIQFNVDTSVELHLYTKGVGIETAKAFFGIMMREYIVSRLTQTTSIQLEITHIEPILQYSPVFPNTLFENQEGLVQLYIRVHISDMRECSEIQSIIDEHVIHKTIYGIEMQVTIIDGVDTSITCNNIIDLQINSADTTDTTDATDCDNRFLSHEITGKMVAGGMVLRSNTSCLRDESEECSAHLTSANVGLFYALLQIITSQVDPLSFYFEHSVDFCGLDTLLLRPLITAETLNVYGMSCSRLV